MKSFNIPVVLIIYKRSSTLELIIEELRKVNASNIYVIADGPRNDNEIADVKQTRNVINTIDWKCNIYKEYSEKNLGLYTRVISGLDYVFSIEDQAIILEDDCIPNSSFFFFMSQMLNRFKENNNVSLISGTNMGLKFNIEHDYDFCSYALIWGWATWKSGWVEYRKLQPLTITTNDFNAMKQTLKNKIAIFHWNNLFTKIQNGVHSSWAHEMTFHLLTQKKLCVVPRYNFISNQGVDHHATHTTKSSTIFFNNLEDIETITYHPGPTRLNKEINLNIERKIFSGGLRPLVSYIVQSTIALFKFQK